MKKLPLEINQNIKNKLLLVSREDQNVMLVYKDKEVEHVPEQFVNQGPEDGSSDGRY